MISPVYFEKVKAYFNGDKTLTLEWFNTIHPALGCSPLSALKAGRSKLVMWLIETGIKKGLL